jgi:hypothetical protein
MVWPVTARSAPSPIALVTMTALAALGACGGKHDSSSSSDPQDCAPTPPPVKPAASCEVTLESPPLPPNADKHVPEGTALTYCSNPPSGGPHYPIWAAFQEYARPVEAPYLVHSLEHGAVILYWKCLAAEASPDPCPERPDIVNQLRKIRDDVPADPLCSDGVRARIIIAPSTTITTDVAAAAWGQTYHAACVDVPTLTAFVHDHYAKGTENFCTPGRTF